MLFTTISKKRGKVYHLHHDMELGKVPRQSWHSDDHNPARQQMIVILTHNLHDKQPRNHAPSHAKEMKERLPIVAQRMEQYFYHKAGSLDEYCDTDTIPSRMEDFATMVLEHGYHVFDKHHAPGSIWPKEFTSF